jgi:hypothetical protein
MYKSIVQSVTKVSKYDDMMNARLSKHVATEFNAQYSAVYSSLHRFWPHEGRKEGRGKEAINFTSFSPLPVLPAKFC